MQNDQQWVQTNNLLLSLNAARSEAIKNDVNMSTFNAGAIPGGAQICSSNNGLTCTGTPWEQGWIVLGVDPANPGNPAPKLLQVVGALPAGTTLTETNNNLNITFLSNGTLNTAALVAATKVEFRMCDIRGPTFARYLQVTLMGRALASATPGMDLNNAPIAACP
jgi:type IV fimbrial biogenesis protein FimT